MLDPIKAAAGRTRHHELHGPAAPWPCGRRDPQGRQGSRRRPDRDVHARPRHLRPRADGLGRNQGRGRDRYFGVCWSSRRRSGPAPHLLPGVRPPLADRRGARTPLGCADARSKKLSGRRQHIAGTGRPRTPLFRPGRSRPQAGRTAPFSFDTLVAQARSLAAAPAVPAEPLPAAVLDKIDYEAHGKIKFNTDSALFRDGPASTRSPSSTSAASSRSACTCTCSKAGGDARARDPVLRRLFRHAGRQPGARTAERRRLRRLLVPGEPARRQAKRDWRKNDWAPSWAPPTSAPWASSTSTACRPAGSRSMPRADRPEEFPNFTRLLLRAAGAGQRPRSWSTRCSTARASPAPIASRCSAAARC